MCRVTTTRDRICKCHGQTDYDNRYEVHSQFSINIASQKQSNGFGNRVFATSPISAIKSELLGENAQLRITSSMSFLCCVGLRIASVVESVTWSYQGTFTVNRSFHSAKVQFERAFLRCEKLDRQLKSKGRIHVNWRNNSHHFGSYSSRWFRRHRRLAILWHRLLRWRRLGSHNRNSIDLGAHGSNLKVSVGRDCRKVSSEPRSKKWLRSENVSIPAAPAAMSKMKCTVTNAALRKAGGEAKPAR
jgi:hypothetical protein